MADATKRKIGVRLRHMVLSARVREEFGLRVCAEASRRGLTNSQLIKELVAAGLAVGAERALAEQEAA